MFDFGFETMTVALVSSHRARPTGADAQAILGLDAGLVRIYRRYARLAAIGAAGLGGEALLGWIAGIPTLANLNPDWVTMKVNTAIAFLAAGVGLFLAVPNGSDRPARFAAVVTCAGLVAAIGFATTAEFIFGLDLRIDQLLIAEPPGAIQTVVPGRMALTTAVSFALFGAALLARVAKPGSLRSTPPALLILIHSMLMLIAYLFGAEERYTFANRYTPMAFPTALAFLLLSSGLLVIGPERGLLRLLASPRSGGVMLRRLLPVIMFGSALILWLRLYGQAAGWFGTEEFGTAIAAVATIFFSSSVLLWVAAQLDRTDAARLQGEAGRFAAQYTRNLIEASLDPLVTISAEGKITDVNKATEEATGYSRSELIGTNFAGYFTEPESAQAGYKEVFENGSVRDYALALRHRSGAVMDVLYNANVYRDEQGEIAGVFAAARDVTARKRADQSRDRALRATRMLNVCNNIAIHAKEEPRLLEDTCRAIIELGGYRLAWVGYAEQDEAKTVRPVAHAGPGGDDYVAGANISWSDQDERGRGPTGTAIRTGKTVTARDTLRDSNFGPWREDAAAKGYRSSLAMPLKDNGNVYGALMVYSDEEDAFDAEETRLLAELAADMAYATMALRTKAAHDRSEQELQKHRTHLEEMVAARTADLAAANTNLAAANKELETFAYSVSHDLRAPLRAIDGFSHILLEEYADKLDAEGKRLLGVVCENTVRMGQLIDDILAFSRAGRSELAKTQIDMEALAHDVIKELEPVVAGRKIDFKVGKLPPAYGDPGMIQRVLTNLLDNAVKYTGPKPEAHIEVGATAGTGENVYFVRDNGVGFDMKYVDKIFGVFMRLHGAEFPGNGIGLAIVSRIISRHGGHVRAEGKLNEGATIYFSLPAQEEHHA